MGQSRHESPYPLPGSGSSKHDDALPAGIVSPFEAAPGDGLIDPARMRGRRSTTDPLGSARSPRRFEAAAERAARRGHPKWAALGTLLDARGEENVVSLSFSEIESVVGLSLPHEARDDAGWWTAEEWPPQIWRLTGWIAEPDLIDRRVSFRRTGSMPEHTPAAPVRRAPAYIPADETAATRDLLAPRSSSEDAKSRIEESSPYPPLASLRRPTGEGRRAKPEKKARKKRPGIFSGLRRSARKKKAAAEALGYDAATCAEFGEGLTDAALARAIVLFGSLEEKGNMDSADLAAALDVPSGRLKSIITDPLNRRAAAMRLDQPFTLGTEPKTSRRTWHDRDGVASALAAALESERSRREAEGAKAA